MAEFASKGGAGSGLGLGIAGTALGLLNNGGNGVLACLVPTADGKIKSNEFNTLANMIFYDGIEARL